MFGPTANLCFIIKGNSISSEVESSDLTEILWFGLFIQCCSLSEATLPWGKNSMLMNRCFPREIFSICKYSPAPIVVLHKMLFFELNFPGSTCLSLAIR